MVTSSFEVTDENHHNHLVTSAGLVRPKNLTLLEPENDA
jgi:hypothetical protein